MFTITHQTTVSFIARTAEHTFVLELARRGSRKINASSFRNAVREGDSLIPLRSVPIEIRRAAYSHLRLGA